MQVAHHLLTWFDWYRERGQSPSMPHVLGEVAEAGYAGVELIGGSAVLGPATQLQRQLDDIGLTAAAYSSFVNATESAENTTQYQDDLDYAAELGISTIMVCGGWLAAPRRTTWEDDYRTFAANLGRAQKYADRHGQTLAFHPHLGCIVEQGDEVEMLLRHLPSLQLCVDTGHLLAVRADPAALVRRFPGRTSYLHLKDWNNDTNSFTELGAGDAGLDLPDLLAALQTDGYTGWLTVERDQPVLPPAESALQSARFLDVARRATQPSQRD